MTSSDPTTPKSFSDHNEQARLNALCDLRDKLTAANTALDALIRTYARNETTEHDTLPDLSLVVWKDAVGPRGPFQMADPKANDNNMVFQRLRQYLTADKRTATVDGYFVWLFPDSKTVGRRPERSLAE